MFWAQLAQADYSLCCSFQVSAVNVYALWHTGSRLSIKMSSYQNMDPHVKDKTVSRPSYLEHGNPHACERRSLYWDGAQVATSLESMENTTGH